MILKIVKRKPVRWVVFLSAFTVMGCVKQEIDTPQALLEPTGAHELQRLETVHGKLRVTTRQALANQVDSLVESHPELLFGYQSLTYGDDPVVANIARYRLAQVHLEMSCGLDELALQYKASNEGSSSGLEATSRSHLQNAERAFERVDFELLAVSREQVERWEKGTERKQQRTDGGDDSARTPQIYVKQGVYLTFSNDPTAACRELEDEYLGPLKPFVY